MNELILEHVKLIKNVHLSNNFKQLVLFNEINTIFYNEKLPYMYIILNLNKETKELEILEKNVIYTFKINNFSYELKDDYIIFNNTNIIQIEEDDYQNEINEPLIEEQVEIKEKLCNKINEQLKNQKEIIEELNIMKEYLNLKNVNLKEINKISDKLDTFVY